MAPQTKGGGGGGGNKKKPLLIFINPMSGNVLLCTEVHDTMN